MIHCRLLTQQITEVLASNTAAALNLGRNRAALRISAEQLWKELRPDLELEQRKIGDAEFAALPDSFLPILHLAWLEAESAGLDFELRSEPPAQPIDQARAGRASVRIDYEETRIVMTVAHVANHHAQWMTEPSAALSSS
ncbi:MAG TPA: hypothetical protein VGA20_04295 [Gemmatimonadales bacterium]|jgi:hypothetical protein